MPTYLILGGLGFIGRNLVTSLLAHAETTKIRVVDKQLPLTAYLTATQLKEIQNEKVEVVQGNLGNANGIKKAMDGEKWDVVVNCAAETKYGLSSEVYDEKVFQLSVACAKEAAERKTPLFIEFSTAQVYDADKKPSKETSNTKPWTQIAKAKLKAEEELAKIPGLNYIILRPAVVYGIGDTNGLMPRFIVAAAYKQLKEEMKLLWSNNLRLNTVHVSDVCDAVRVLAENFETIGGARSIRNGSVWNLADTGETDQGLINGLISTIFGIKTGFHGTIISNLAKLDLGGVTEESNEKHLAPWSDLCKANDPAILSTPLSPYLDKELLYNNSLSVDGSLISSTIPSFNYKVAKVSEFDIREIINAWIEVGAFPKGLI